MKTFEELFGFSFGDANGGKKAKVVLDHVDQNILVTAPGNSEQSCRMGNAMSVLVSTHRYDLALADADGNEFFSDPWLIDMFVNESGQDPLDGAGTGHAELPTRDNRAHIAPFSQFLIQIRPQRQRPGQSLELTYVGGDINEVFYENPDEAQASEGTMVLNGQLYAIVPAD